MPIPLIQYCISVSSLAGHTFDVTLEIEQPDKSGQILSLPAWIPGSYMIRDFAKNIICIEANTQCGNKIHLQKLDKQTWKLPPDIGPVIVKYQVYAFDFSIRGAYINDEIAFFNGTNMFLAVDGQTQQPSLIKIEKPKTVACKEWRVATTMPTKMIEPHQFGEYWAPNYDVLIDHPVLLGEFDILPFSTSEVDFELILAGGHQADVGRIVKDLEIICSHQIAFFDDTPPINRYQFITLLTDSGFGGLEHISSTALMYSRNDLPSKTNADEMTDGYRIFLSLCSHEFFHTWHVKRIKPIELFNAELDQEKYTEQLWIYEGFTSYYDDLSLLKCGLIDQAEYLKVMGQNITRLIRNQGRFKQSVTESSFYAWSKFYKQDESAINNIVSYYNKGAVLAMCLDLTIKLKSNGHYSLDDVLRHLWQQYGKLNIPTPIDVIQTLVKSTLDLDVNEFLQMALYTTQELPFEGLLEKFGVRCQFFPRENFEDKGGVPTKSSIKVDFGAQIKAREIGVQILQVIEQSAAYDSGLQVGDVLIAIDKWEINKQNLVSQLNQLTIGQTAQLTVLRDKKLKNLSFHPAPATCDTVTLAVIDEDLCRSWLG
jgi:predicted metalloprotease with PDZ domain